MSDKGQLLTDRSQIILLQNVGLLERSAIFWQGDETAIGAGGPQFQLNRFLVWTSIKKVPVVEVVADKQAREDFELNVLPVLLAAEQARLERELQVKKASLERLLASMDSGIFANMPLSSESETVRRTAEAKMAADEAAAAVLAFAYRHDVKQVFAAPA